MGKHNFKYFFHEGISNMFSHGFMSFAAIGTTVACLLIMGTFTLVAVNADANLKEMESENEILAFVDESYTRTQAMAIQPQLEALPNVAEVTFITKEDVANKLFKEIGPKYADRNGGYTRVVRIGPRRGDAAEMAIIQLV